MDLVLLLLLVLLRREVIALRLLSVNVPPYKFKDETAHLVCRYDLETEKLYSVLWYKDNEEFYKYVNTDRSQHIYQVDGIKVDHRNSDGSRVILQRVNLDTTGVYKCEVSAEAPHFASTYGEAYMEVVVMPAIGPAITGQEKSYASGDILSLNCTSSKSYPPAEIKWFINEVEVEADSTRTISHRDQLVTTISSLRLELGPHHLSSGKSSIKCRSTVRTSSRAREAVIDVRDTNVEVQGSASFIRPCLSLLLVVVILDRILRMD
ncbi:uncharacterized protein LOC103574415 isoform X2 [Microplitis demolitor]|uniref:uncharacterized protein LOC103574415 isoform X2 n=1 Tax=Microplitis demolitor TaxID=69319 RepID=UPI0004CD8FBF|nr:uncharacterized protein LOC103574415 isoform X2 [Microplitis demolitor]